VECFRGQADVHTASMVQLHPIANRCPREEQAVGHKRDVWDVGLIDYTSPQCANKHGTAHCLTHWQGHHSVLKPFLRNDTSVLEMCPGHKYLTFLYISLRESRTPSIFSRVKRSLQATCGTSDEKQWHAHDCIYFRRMRILLCSRKATHRRPGLWPLWPRADTDGRIGRQCKCYDTALIFLEYEIVAMGRRSKNVDVAVMR
jgi:hypothetical protein